MHRALYFGKVLYEHKVTRDNRAAFLRMCKDAHNAPDARQELQECLKITWRIVLRTGCRLRMGCLQALPSTLQMVVPCQMPMI
jgi:hypothetical protein